MKWFVASLALGVAVLAGSVREVVAEEDGADAAVRVLQVIQNKSFSVSAAAATAEKETGGRAVRCEVEVEDGRAVVEVLVAVEKPVPQLLEVEVDGASNRILEIEDADGEDEDDDDSDDSDASGGSDSDAGPKRQRRRTRGPLSECVLHRSLVGHGNAINELTFSPTNRDLLLSASTTTSRSSMTRCS